MNKDTLDAIKATFIKAVNRERITILECRYEYGCAIQAIQKITGDIGGNGRPTFDNARQIALSWATEASATDRVTDNVLKQATYISQHLNKSQLAMVAQKGMKFNQVYSMLCCLKDNKKVNRALVDIRSGKDTDFARWGRQRSGTEPLFIKVSESKAGRRKNAESESYGRVDVSLYDDEGTIDEEKMQILFETLLTRYPELTYKAYKSAMMRVTKRSSKVA